MSENLTALASENLNPSLRSLLEDVQRGHIRVPRFQRPFIWQDEQRLELLDSIRMNMPIGSLLVWRTAKFKLATFSNVGPHVIPAIAEQAPATGWQYLLDGHQRVTTLLGLLLQPDASAGALVASEEEIDWDIRYDIMSERFVFAAKVRRGGAARPMLPLWTLFDGRQVNRQLRELRKQATQEGWTEDDLDRWEERADQLSYRFQQYRIPIVVMVTEDLQQAAQTFHRINSQGTPMAEAHLVAALTWTTDFDLRARFHELRASFPPGWRDSDDGLFLQVCKGLAGLDMTKEGQTELVAKIKEDPKLLDRAGTGMARAMQWLGQAAAVQRPDLLPYALQLVLLAVEMAGWDERPLPEKALKEWFWRTAWSEVFASATWRQVQVEQQLLQTAVAGQRPQPKWVRDEDLPARFDFRSARARLVALRLALRPSVLTPDGQPIDARSLLATHGREALVRLFPAPRRSSLQLKRLLQGVGNRFLLEPGSEAVWRERLVKGPSLQPQVLESNFVDAQAEWALRQGDLEGFLGRRAQVMNEWDRGQWQEEVWATGYLRFSV